MSDAITEDYLTDRKSKNARVPSHPTWSVHGVIYLDTGISGQEQLDREIKNLENAPRGASIVLDIKPGQMVPVSAICYLRQHAPHIKAFSIRCPDPGTVEEWIHVLKFGYHL